MRFSTYLKRRNRKKPPINVLPDDVFLVSYPKSGNTWVRFLIGNYLTGNKCDFTNSHLIIPDIHFNPEQCSKIQQPRFIKSHNKFTSAYPRVVYIVRDGRDVAISYYFHTMKIGKISEDANFEDYLEKFNSGLLDRFSTWSNHVNSWLNNASNNFLLVRYEDLKLNPLQKLIQILEFSGISINYDVAEAAVEASKFEKMKFLEKSQQEMFEGFAKYDSNIPFVRSGEVGNWKTFFTRESTSRFIKIHGSALERLGYQSSNHLLGMDNEKDKL